MSGTSLYRALIEAGAKEDTAKEAAVEIDTMGKTLTEVKVLVRINTAILIALMIKSFFL